MGKRVILLLDQADFHTGGEVVVPEGMELEFLPARSPKLQPTERLWPLVNEKVANRLLLEYVDKLVEEALVESGAWRSRGSPSYYEAPRATTGGRRQHRAMRCSSGRNRRTPCWSRFRRL